MLDFIDRHGLTFPSVVDRPGAVFAGYGVPYQPAWVFIAADGTVTKFQGSLEGSTLAVYLKGLIAPNAA